MTAMVKTLWRRAPIIVLVAMVSVGLGFGNSLASHHKHKRQFPTVVQTKYGKVKGYNNTDQTVAWTGIPFAKPPVGDLRWKAPRNPERWRGVLDATQPCVPCTQLLTTEKWIRTGEAEGSEDCLYLSIYRPSHNKRLLPVYVYIHGGSNSFGTANDYDGSNIAAKGDMVVVVVQYRLGPLGWFTHPALREGRSSLDDSGNFGTLDNIKALQWIRKNIRAFGGNPHNVTITGESAGAHNVMNLVISPLAKGLFHRAMSESGGMTTDTVAEGEEQAEDHIDALLSTCIENDEAIEECLRNIPAGELFEAYFAMFGTLPTYDAYQDGVVIPGSVVSTIRSGKYNKVPIILGANQYETKSFMPLYGPSLYLPWFDLIGVLDDNGKTVDDVLPTDFDKELYEISGYYGSRNWRGKFVDERARALKEQQNRVYAYQFNWGGPGSGPSPFDFIYGAGHAMEIAFFFGGDESLWGYGYNPDNDTPGRVALSDAMMRYLANFAKRGNPNGAGLPVWRKWSNRDGGPKVILFDSDYDEALLDMSTEEVSILEEQSKLAAEIGTWDSIAQDTYGWVPWAFQWSTPE
jgi:para-nitrobenzyl esterase